MILDEGEKRLWMDVHGHRLIMNILTPLLVPVATFCRQAEQPKISSHLSRSLSVTIPISLHSSGRIKWLMGTFGEALQYKLNSNLTLPLLPLVSVHYV